MNEKRKKLDYILILIIIISLFLLTGATSLFPSKDYMKMTFSEKVSRGYSANILINGDSIGGGTEDGEWGTLLKEKLEDNFESSINVQNISKPGNSSFAGIVSWEMLGKSQQVFSDLVILCYGQNDPDDASFAVNYEALIRNTIEGNPNAEILVILESSQRDYTNKIKTIMDLCDHYHIPYVDMIEAFNVSGYTYQQLSDDGIHPNELGKEVYANAIYNTIHDKLLTKQSFWDFKGERPKQRQAMNPESEKYKSCQYIPLKNMTTNNGCVTIQIPQCKILGLDVLFEPGNHTILLSLSNKEYDATYSWPYNFSQRHIYEVLEGDFEQGILEINFDSLEEAGNLVGVVCFE